ncbi:DNA polymerase III subunit beta [Candidatus Parcubacteria bacterium]|nr:DNA polymerase III subunit beta [Candidatus Parcubacteria bacterium]
MKFICTQENLNKALSVVGKVVNKNSTLPILNNVLLKTEKGMIKLSSTNLEIGVSYYIGGIIEEKGEITIPTKLFANFISNLPAGNVEIKLREDVVNIKCNGYKTNIKGIDAKEYPLTPKLEIDPVFKIKSSEFKKALAQVMPAISNSESRVEITGVLMNLEEIGKNKITLVATDSYRLAEKTLKLEQKDVAENFQDLLGNMKSVIIPKETVQELVRDIGEGDEIIEVVISEGQILFKFGNASVISRLIEGKYPDYKQIIPTEFKFKISTEKNRAIKAIKIASLFSNISNNSVEFKFSLNTKNLEINAETSDLGNNNTKIPVEIEINKEMDKEGVSIKDGNLSIFYNHKSLIDGLNSVEGDSIFLKVNDENSPTVLVSTIDSAFVYVIMPIRV